MAWISAVIFPAMGDTVDNDPFVFNLEENAPVAVTQSIFRSVVCQAFDVASQVVGEAVNTFDDLRPIRERNCLESRIARLFRSISKVIGSEGGSRRPGRPIGGWRSSGGGWR